LQYGCALAIAQIRQQDGFSVGQLKGIVMDVRPILVDPSKSRHLCPILQVRSMPLFFSLTTSLVTPTFNDAEQGGTSATAHYASVADLLKVLSAP
jgi:hypothetical protein